MRAMNAFSIVFLLMCSTILPACGSAAKNEKWQKAQSIYEAHCKNDANGKIYRRVENVEGILLLKIRPQQSDTQWRDRNYPGAAFADEPGDEGYITQFLANEHPIRYSDPKMNSSPGYRGYVGLSPGGKPGYRYVDVVDVDGLRYRYTLVSKPRPTSNIGWVDIVLAKEITESPKPRYAVTYEDHVIPEERVLGIASSTVKVIDLQTDELLGEFTRYVLGGGFEQITAQNSSPWLSAYKCSKAWIGGTTGASTRLFVDQVLIPKKGD